MGLRPAPPWPALGVLLNAAVWGLSWWPMRALEAGGLHPLWATAAAYSVSTMLLLLWRPAAALNLLRTPSLWPLLLASGATNVAFNWAVTIGEVTRVVLLFYLAPLWMVLLARVMLHETLGRAALLRVALSLVGAVIVLLPVGASDSAPVEASAAGQTAAAWLSLADVLAIAGGMGFALFNVLLRREARQRESSRALAMFAGGLLVPALLAGVIGAMGWAVLPLPGAEVLPVLPLALLLGVALLGANLALQYGAARLPAQVTAVIMPTELVFAAGSAAWIAGEVLGSRLLLGSSLVLLATLMAAWPARAD